MFLDHTRSAAPPVGNRLLRQAAVAVVLCAATWTLTSCSTTSDDPPPTASSVTTAFSVTTTSPQTSTASVVTTEGDGPILVVPTDTAFPGVNYEADPSIDENMKNPRLLGAPTAVDGPSGSTLTITAYSIDGFNYASRPLAPASGTVLRFVTVAWTRGQLTEGSSVDAGTVEVVRAGRSLADREQLSLEPRPASQQDLPTSYYGWIVAVDPDTDTAVVSYSITAGGSGLAGSVRVRDGSPT